MIRNSHSTPNYGLYATKGSRFLGNKKKRQAAHEFIHRKQSSPYQASHQGLSDIMSSNQHSAATTTRPTIKKLNKRDKKNKYGYKSDGAINDENTYDDPHFGTRRRGHHRLP